MTHVRALPYDPADIAGAREFVARVVDESARVNVVDSPVRAAIAALPPGSERAHPSAVVLSLMREAEEALARGNESVAFDRYESVLRQYADSEMHVRAAALAVRLERYAAALAHCAAAIRIDEMNGAAYREQGVALERQQPGSGIDSLKRAVELTPNDYDAWSSLGGALRRQGRNAEALAAYQRAVTISNGDPYPLLNVLKLKKLAGSDADVREQGFLRAAARLRRADVDAPAGPRDVPWSYFDLAEIERYLGNGASAEQLLREGADRARLSQLQSHRNAIAPLAAATGEPTWVAAVAYLDEVISAARAAAGGET
jgi:tetratricopeptide (TPR) repeat protein